MKKRSPLIFIASFLLALLGLTVFFSFNEITLFGHKISFYSLREINAEINNSESTQSDNINDFYPFDTKANFMLFMWDNVGIPVSRSKLDKLIQLIKDPQVIKDIIIIIIK